MAKQPLVFVKPVKPINEMTEEELDDFCTQVVAAMAAAMPAAKDTPPQKKS